MLGNNRCVTSTPASGRFNVNLWMYSMVEAWAWSDEGSRVGRPQRQSLGQRAAATFACRQTQGIAA